MPIEPLKIRIAEDKGQRYAVVENFPGLWAEMTPAQLYLMANELIAAAVKCESRGVEPIPGASSR
jgi:hypothetical protein